MYTFVQVSNSTARSSVADPERFDADPDPTFQADVDPDFSSKSSPILSKILLNLTV